MPECYVDTNLVKTILGIRGHDVNHKKGCNNVTRSMDIRYKDRFALGIIDKDKTSPTYVSDFTTIASSDHLILLKHRDRHHYIVQVKPAMEEFIVSCAREKGINLSEYGLPCEMPELRKEAKRVRADDDDRFKRLFMDLKDVEEIKILKAIMEYLLKHKYSADDETLRSFFNSAQ